MRGHLSWKKACLLFNYLLLHKAILPMALRPLPPQCGHTPPPQASTPASTIAISPRITHKMHVSLTQPVHNLNQRMSDHHTLKQTSKAYSRMHPGNPRYSLVSYTSGPEETVSGRGVHLIMIWRLRMEI